MTVGVKSQVTAQAVEDWIDKTAFHTSNRPSDELKRRF
jgi:hypothetical protein